MENKQLNKDIKFGLKTFLSSCGILLAVMILVGILTYVIPAGAYQMDADGKVIPDSFALLEAPTRLPVYRWFTAPVEELLIGQGNFNIIQIIAVLLVLAGSFKVLDLSGGLYAIVQVIIQKFYHKRYLVIWVITALMMLLASCFGLQEELLILFPIFLSFSKAMGWSNRMAACLVLITTGVGFTTATFNPFTVGIASDLAGISVMDGLWYRVIIFGVLYVLTSLYLILLAKQDEKRNAAKALREDFITLSESERLLYAGKARMVFSLFAAVLLVIIVASTVPFLADLGLGMVFMSLTFVIGSFMIGKNSLGSLRAAGKGFLQGAKDLSPSIIIILLAFSVKYIAENGNILHTLFYYCHSYISRQSPYAAVTLLYLLILVLEFFIPGAAAKALLLIPMLTLAPLPGISVNIIILAFLFGDGYTNVLYPTCATLVVGLGLAEVSYVDWLKKTGWFQAILFLLSLGFLLLAVYIGL